MNVRIGVLAARKGQPQLSKLLGWVAGSEAEREFYLATLMLAQQ